MRPIGFVEVGVPRAGGVDEYRYSFVSVIRVYDEYAEGLEGLEEYSHAFVLWYFHEAGEGGLKVRPVAGEVAPEVGVFATRSPLRPNRIALTIVKLVEVSPPRVRVMGLDAWTGSPVLDIKPYDHFDVVNEFRTPDWLEEHVRRVISRLPPWLGPRYVRGSGRY
jgi:tRNA-Thr(GGU) m(6)t(6)A37 methyltransferase TsaA